MANVQAIPDGYHTATPYLYPRGAADAIAFYKKAFGAVEKMPPMIGPDGKIGHAEITIGDSTFMLSDENAEMGAKSPQQLGGSPISIVLYLPDCDAATKQAVAAGATVVMEPADQFYGDRASTLEDPFGFQWHIHTHIEDVEPDEMERRMSAMAAGAPA
jgi:PhnB protein